MLKKRGDRDVIEGSGPSSHDRRGEPELSLTPGPTMGTSSESNSKPEAPMPPSKSFFRAVVLPLALLFVLQSQAKADKVDNLVKQMTKSGDYKLRLSAALNLKKLKDKRPSVINGFIKALKDSNKTVRGVAAAALGDLVTSRTKARTRARALKALQKVRDGDQSSFVQRQAGKAYDKLKNVGGAAPSAGGIYIDVSGMAAKASSGKAFIGNMKKAALKAIKQKAPSWVTAWPGGGRPSGRALKSKSMKAFHVGGTITELKEIPGGSQTTISCKVSMILATYPSKSMFGFASGGAQVSASSNARELKFAKEDCVAAVVESLVGQNIVPTIKIKAR